MTALTYVRPESTDVVSTLLQRDGARLIAGATDLLVQMHGGRVQPITLVDLNALPDLAQISADADGAVTIGATVRMSRLSTDPLTAAYPALIEGAETVGSIQIRNRATLIGNVCNASPAADTAPALLVYEAQVNIVGPDGRRTVAVEEFWVGPGKTSIRPGEWVESITLPSPGRHGGCYVKLGRTMGVDLAVVGVAAFVSAGEARIGLASVAPTPIRARRVEAAIDAASGTLLPGATDAIQEAIAPISDVRSSADYRRAMTEVLVERAIRLAHARLTGENEVRND